MHNRFLERRPPKRVITGLAPPFDRRIDDACEREMMSKRFRFGVRAGREPVAKRLGDAPMQRSPTALQQIVVGTSPGSARAWKRYSAMERPAFDDQDEGFGEPFQRIRVSAASSIGAATVCAVKRRKRLRPSTGADQRRLARRSKPRSKPRRATDSRVGGIVRAPSPTAALQQQPRDFLHVKAHRPCARRRRFRSLRPKAHIARGDIADHLRGLGAVKAVRW